MLRRAARPCAAGRRQPAAPLRTAYSFPTPHTPAPVMPLHTHDGQFEPEWELEPGPPAGGAPSAPANASAHARRAAGRLLPLKPPFDRPQFPSPCANPPCKYARRAPLPMRAAIAQTGGQEELGQLLRSIWSGHFRLPRRPGWARGAVRHTRRSAPVSAAARPTLAGTLAWMHEFRVFRAYSRRSLEFTVFSALAEPSPCWPAAAPAGKGVLLDATTSIDAIDTNLFQCATQRAAPGRCEASGADPEAGEASGEAYAVWAFRELYMALSMCPALAEPCLAGHQAGGEGCGHSLDERAEERPDCGARWRSIQGRR